MSKKLILHIGAEKTATTAIQKCLSNNRDALSRMGIIYPITSFSEDAHFSLVAALHKIDHGKRLEFAPPGEYTYESEWKPLIDQFRALDDESKMILSAEHFSSRLKDKGLEALSKIITEFNADELEVVYYFRRQDLYFQSWYSTYIKAGGSKKINEIYPNLIKDKWFFDYYFVKNRWEKHFPDAVVKLVPFDEVRKSGSILKHFFSNFVSEELAKLNLNVNSVDSNLAWSAEMIGIGRSINSIYGSDFKNRYQILECINNYSLNSSKSKYIIPLSVSQNILMEYKESNLKICSDLNLHYDDIFHDLLYTDYDDPDSVLFNKDMLLDLLIKSPVWRSS